LFNFALNLIKSRLAAQSGFVLSARTLVSGSLIAQGISFLALPILTRLYTPGDFNTLAVYAAFVAIFAAVACLRLDIAIPLPKEDKDAVCLLVFALIISGGISFALGIFVYFFKIEIISSINLQILEQYIWLLPIGIWFTSTFTALQYWSTRNKRFKLVAQTRVLQNLSGSIFQILYGLLGAGPFGLIVGLIINSATGAISFLKREILLDISTILSVRWSHMCKVLGSYSRFPTYSTFDALANTSGSQIPIILIAAIAIGPEAGYLALAIKVISTPLMVVSSSVGQVYLSQAAEQYRKGVLAIFTYRIFNGLLLTGVGPALTVAMIAPEMFAIIFGDEWKRAGEILTYMAPAIIFQFMSTPISMVMHVRMLQIQMLILMIFGLLLRAGSIVLAYNYFSNYIVEAYSLSAGFYYLTLFFIFYKLSGCDFKRLLRLNKKSIMVIGSWIILGILIKGFFLWK
jgi:O-antigen/teichoic acid export membrane protein